MTFFSTCSTHKNAHMFQVPLTCSVLAWIRQLSPSFQHVWLAYSRGWYPHGCHYRSPSGMLPLPLMSLRCSGPCNCFLALVIPCLLVLGQQCTPASWSQQPECMQVIRPCVLRSKLNLAAARMPQRRALRTHTVVKSQYTKQEKVHTGNDSAPASQSVRIARACTLSCRVTAVPLTSAFSFKTKVSFTETRTMC